MKCDMHVHSWHSGPTNTPVLNRVVRECYSDPEELMDRLRRRGMDLVTVTDHDTIEGCLLVQKYPNVFLSEEVTCRMPSGTQFHMGVYDLTERQHVQIQRRRDDLPSLLMYLTERRIFFSVNHIFSGLTGARAWEDFDWLREYFPAVETRNGQMLAAVNRRAKELARRWRKIGVGGSDAHTCAWAGTTYTAVPGAGNKREFLDGLRAGHGYVLGAEGGYGKLSGDILRMAGQTFQEKPWTAAFAFILLLVPAVMLFHNVRELAFARFWAARVLGEGQPPQTAVSPGAAAAIVSGGEE